MWHTRSGFPRHPFGLRPRFSLVEGMIGLAVVGFFCLIAVAAVTSVDSPSLGGPVINAFDGDHAAARRAAESLGFTNVRITDEDHVMPELKGCGEDDGAAYSVVARNQLEKEVQLTVCCGGFGSLKGCTIRTP